MSSTTKLTILQLLNILAVAGAVTVSALANALPINDRTTGELSALYPNLFVPAGITFSIWGLIYLLLIGFALFQARTLASREKDGFVERIGGWFFLAGVANASWIFAWHYERVGLSVLIMIVLLLSLLATYLRLGIGATPAPPGERFLIRLPISVYLGWVTVATIANVTAYLVATGWEGFGLPDQAWAALMIAAAAAITLVIVRTRGDVAFSLVVLWALLGILIRRLQMDPEPLYPVLVILAASMTAILGALLFLRPERRSGATAA
jgi:translocator protein